MMLDRDDNGMRHYLVDNRRQMCHTRAMGTTYPPEMLERMRRDDLRGRMATAIHAGNRWVMRTCSEYHATMTRRMVKDDVIALLTVQDVHCGLCGISLENTRWVIDHDHAVERKHSILLVRGLICTKCNAWLGHHEAMVKAGVEYLNGACRSVLK